MSIDFIFFGLIFILFFFKFIKSNNKIVNVIIILTSLFICFGYVISPIMFDYVAINLFHFVAYIVLIFACNIFYKVNSYDSILISIFYYVLLTINSEGLIIYNPQIFATLLLIPSLIHLNDVVYGFCLLVNNCFFALCVDGYFHFKEINYLNFDFSIVFKIFVVYLISAILFKSLLLLVYGSRRFVVNEKKYFYFAFNFDFSNS